MVLKNRHFKNYLTTSSALQVSLLCLAEHIQPCPLCHFLLSLGETPALMLPAEGETSHRQRKQIPSHLFHQAEQQKHSQLPQKTSMN